MYTELKGRIFRTQGISYLVLQEENESSEWLKVKSLNPKPEVRRMRAEEVRRYLGQPVRA